MTRSVGAGFITLGHKFEQQVRAVGVIADGEDLIDEAFADKIVGFLNNGINSIAGLLRGEDFAFDFGRPARPYEVVKA